MYKRNIIKKVHKALDRQAAVALIGPRQVGKTTLALQVAQTTSSIYLDLEAMQDREKLTDPVLFFNRNEEKLIILDEIHRMPEIFQVLRGVIDTGRRKGLKTNRFLILGSASIDLLKQSGETLAGRIEYIDMNPLNLIEINNNKKQHDKIEHNLWIRGGFPDSYLAKDDEDSFAYRTNFIRTYLERDVPQFGPRIPAETLQRLWTMLAHNQGQLLNASTLASSLSTSAPTISSYIDLLVDLLLVRKLQPLYVNTKKRLVKSPRIYVRDSGITHALLGLTDYNQLSGHPVYGSSWEAYVIENIVTLAKQGTKASFYRTAAGAEIDLILEFPNNKIWAIEIKSGLTPKTTKGFYNALDDIKPEKSFVVYGGNDRYPLSEKTDVIGLYEILKLIVKDNQ